MKAVAAALARMSMLDWLFLIACLTSLSFCGVLTISANTDLAVGRFALFMDERITFDGVKKILHPDDLVQFFYSIGDGRDHRYGRSLWNSIAIFSAIPERLFGDSGQIISARMLQVFLIVASWVVLGFGILRSWFLRFALLAAMLTIPFSHYYMTMPKPEPLQLFFLTIFSYFFVKKNAVFSWYWILLGLAFGTKISALPAVLVFFAAALACRSSKNSSSDSGNSLKNAAFAFFLGLAIAVPILFAPLLLSIIGYFAFSWLVKKLSLGEVSATIMAVSIIAIVFLASRRVLKIWISQTFLNTTHGADSANINALSWIDYFFDSWLVAPHAIGLLLFMLILVYLVHCLTQILKAHPFPIDQRTAALAISIAGLALNIAIFLTAKRLWGLYLYPGTILMVAGVMILIDFTFAEKQNTNQGIFRDINIFAGYVVSLALLVISMVYWAPVTIEGLKTAAVRTKSTDYKLQYDSYKAFVDFLENYNPVDSRRLYVMWSPWLFAPESNEKYHIVEFWGPYVQWSGRPDVIIFSSDDTPKGLPFPKDSPLYSNFLKAREGYAMQVADKGAKCKVEPCFVRELQLPNGGEVLTLSKLD